ncbi:MAG: hypothetical protein HQL30_03255 [Candidatus Omnitrophica bacterium]|nr:hypothetical protein [Candidatus Omnitrophota bacterium]
MRKIFKFHFFEKEFWALTLAFFGLMSLGAFKGVAYNPNPWAICGFYSIFAASYFIPENILSGVPARIVQNRFILPGLTLLFLAAAFISVFPLKDWGKYIAEDDFPVVYYHTVKGLEALKQGGYFGWNSSLVGGYFTATEMGTNLILFIWPFLFAGWKVAYHMMLFSFFLLFPAAVFFYLKSAFPLEDSKKFIPVMPLAGILELVFIQDLLYFGMVGCFLGVVLAPAAFAFYERAKHGKAFAFPMTLLTLTLIFYAHLGVFFYTVLFLGVYTVVRPGWKVIRKLPVMGAMMFFTTLPFTIYQFLYPGYIISENEKYIPGGVTAYNWAQETLTKLVRVLWPGNWEFSNGAQFLFIFIALIIYVFVFARRYAFPAISAVAVVVIHIIYPMEYQLIFSRIHSMMPFFISAILGAFVAASYGGKRNIPVFIGTICLALAFIGSIWGPEKMRYLDPAQFSENKLVKVIKHLPGRFIAVENNQHFLHWGRVVIPEFHWIPLLQLETGKLFFSNGQDGFHHSPYRVHGFTGGYFRGKLIDECGIDEMNGILRKWGVKYLVMWNEKSKNYFSGYPQYYQKMGEYGPWNIFMFGGADLASAFVEGGGNAEVTDNDFYGKKVALAGVARGARVTLRSNYFPAWKAFYEGKSVPLENNDGEISFRAPAAGDSVIEMKYPRFTLVLLMALLAILASFLFFSRDGDK